MGPISPAAFTGRSSVALEGVFRFYTRSKKSFIMFVEEPVVAEMQVPIKSIIDWRLRGSCVDGLSIFDLQDGDDLEVFIPKWLAKKEGVV